MKLKFANALSLALIVAMLFTSVALAENVKNDVLANGNDTITAPGSTTIRYWIQDTGPGGCEASDGTPVTINIIAPAGVTATPSSLVFSACNTSSEGNPNNTQNVVFSSSTQGDYAISVSPSEAVGGDPASVYNSSPATFTLHVLAASNTSPNVVVTGVIDGETYNKGSVPAATCEVTDTEDGNSSFAATLSAITGPYASDGIGSQTASCSYTDAGGLTANASATYSIVDPTAPVIGYTLTPTDPDGSNGWYKGDVSLDWTVTESESPSSLQLTGCDDQVITVDQLEMQYSCSATSAGGSAGPVSVSIKRDGTAPSVTVTPARAADVAGWYNAPVAFDTAGTDATSGVLDANCTADQNYTGPDGSGLTLNGSCTDNAGNEGNGTSAAFNFDDTNPTLTWNGSINNGDSFYFGSVPAASTCTAADATSGPGSCAVTGYGTTVGTHTLTGTAYDVAGNSYIEQRSYEVKAWTLSGFYAPVDRGIHNTVKAGATVPLKFEVFAGPTELTATDVVLSFTLTRVQCDGSLPEDAVEITSTGATTLRYDATAGQFIQNWQTPRQAGTCYLVKMTTDDGSFLTALFKLK